jgi:nitroimidazol reductase NimA-like FMN-containing flavoprotein (pyridoxamine 5'-phosphate oxidase superfamily)
MPTDVPTDHSGLRVMGTDECLERIRSTAVGRVAFTRDGQIILLPVHHVVRGMDVYFRTSGGSKIEAAADHDPMGFEVDEYDASAATGWSVALSGTASVVDDDEFAAELESLDRRPWPIGEGGGRDSVWIRIRSEQITGRELLPH